MDGTWPFSQAGADNNDGQETWLMAVAVVLSEGGNQAEDISGGAAIIVTPLIPFRMAQAWQLWISL